MLNAPAWTDGDVVATGTIGNHGAGESPGISIGGPGTTVPLSIGNYYSIEWGGDSGTPDVGWYRRRPSDGGIIDGPRWDIIWNNSHPDGFGCSQDTYPPTYDVAWAKYWIPATYGRGWRIYFGPYNLETIRLRIPYYLDDYNWMQNSDVMHWKVRRAYFNASVVDVGMLIDSVHIYNVCFQT
jgi:hypothetical protein